MKKALLPLLLFPLPAFTQEFTPPDTDAIRESGVESVKIYYTGTGMTKYLTQEYRYDRRGHCIYSREGNAGYYYVFEYNEKGYRVGETQRLLNGDFVQARKYDTHPGGKPFHITHYGNGDSLIPMRTSVQDLAGKLIEEANFHKGRMTQHRRMEWKDGTCIHLIDSVPGNNVKETRNGRYIRQSIYTPDNQLTDTWLFHYNIALDTCRHIRPGEKTDVYTFEYDPQHHLSGLFLNGKRTSEKAKEEWMNTWGFLLPQDAMGEDYGLPTAPTRINHDIKRDKNGNILEDKVAPAESWNNNPPITFTYEYTYFKK